MATRKHKNVRGALITLAITLAVTVIAVLAGSSDLAVGLLLGLIAAEVLVLGRLTAPSFDDALPQHESDAD